RYIHESITAVFGSVLGSGAHDRVIGTRERDSIDDHQLAGIAGNIDALPEAQRSEQAGMGIGDEPLGELRQRRITLAPDLRRRVLTDMGRGCLGGSTR